MVKEAKQSKSRVLLYKWVPSLLEPRIHTYLVLLVPKTALLVDPLDGRYRKDLPRFCGARHCPLSWDSTCYMRDKGFIEHSSNIFS